MSAPSGLFARLRSLWRGLTRRSAIESDMAEEFRHHIELRTRDLIDTGLSPREARRHAHVEFGHTETHREAGRASRGLHFLDEIRFSWIDVRLGLRMLVKHPGLTVVAVFALAIGIPVGLAPLHFFQAFKAPLPVDGGDRIRAIRYYNVGAEGPLGRSASAYELSAWSEELSSFSALGGFFPARYAIPSREGASSPVEGAEVTASIFDILRVRPLLGRALDPADEVPGAGDVAVLGYDLWQSRFAGDPDVIGSSLDVSGIRHTVVGVMPDGFRFPNSQQIWLPFRQEGAGTPGEGVPISVFGRLADGVSAQEADAQVAAVGRRMAVEFPEARAGYVAQVVPFGLIQLWMPRGSLATVPEFYAMQLPALLLLIVACANVAMLVFARTATRFHELAVRTALGANRLRILSQLFAEALLLALLAAGIGLLAADVLGSGFSTFLAQANGTPPPFWLDFGITTRTALWGVGLAVLSAGIAGVVPALAVTGRRVQRSLQRAGARRSGLRFGGVTTVLVVADVAVAVSAIGAAAWLSNAMLGMRNADDIVGIAAEEYLSVELQLPMGSAGSLSRGAGPETLGARLALTQTRLVERLAADPGVRGVAVAQLLPRMEHPTRSIELDGAEGSVRALIGDVDPDFFTALQRPIVSGRSFMRDDLDADVRPLIVNTAFVEEVLGGRNPLGRRVRFPTRDDTEPPWQEVVGVVGHLGMTLTNPDGEPGVYRPVGPGEIHPLRLAVHIAGTPAAFVPRMRRIVAEVDPAATLEALPLEEVTAADDWLLLVTGTTGLAVLVAVLLTLAISGLYAILSFAVSERTREIGVRTALGADRKDVAVAIVKRALWQIALGVLLGMPLVVWMLFDVRADSNLAIGLGSTVLLALLIGMLVMALIALLACTVPTLRALRIEPTRALQADT